MAWNNFFQDYILDITRSRCVKKRSRNHFSSMKAFTIPSLSREAFIPSFPTNFSHTSLHRRHRHHINEITNP